MGRRGDSGARGGSDRDRERDGERLGGKLKGLRSGLSAGSPLEHCIDVGDSHRRAIHCFGEQSDITLATGRLASL